MLLCLAGHSINMLNMKLEVVALLLTLFPMKLHHLAESADLQSTACSNFFLTNNAIYYLFLPFLEVNKQILLPAPFCRLPS